MNTSDLGSLIRLKRRIKGLKQKDLAELLHVSAVAVSKWENGKNFPDFENLQALSSLFEIPIEDLLEGCSQPPSGQSLQKNPAPQAEGSTEPSDTAVPDAEDTPFPETPVLPVPQPEDVSDCPPSTGRQEKKRKIKLAVPLLAFLLVGIIAVCWIGGRGMGKEPSFLICDSYYGNYNGEDVYYVIVEYDSESTFDDLFHFNEIIREKYGEHLSVVDTIVVIYAQDYTDYIEKGFNDNTDTIGTIFPLPE